MQLSTKLDLTIDGQPYEGKVAVRTVGPVEPPESAEKPSLKSALAGVVSGGAIAKYSWNGFQLSNTLTHDQLVDGLVANGVTPEFAPGIANTALKVVQAEPTKILMVAVSAGGGAWAVLEAGGKFFGWRLSKLRKLLIILIVAALAAVAYIVLRSFGIAR